MGLPTRAIGFMSKLRVGPAEGNGGTLATCNIVFGVKNGTVKSSSQEFEVGDTESGAFTRYQPGRYTFEANFTAFIDTSPQYKFFTKLSVGGSGVVGNVIWLNYYATGIVSAALGPISPSNIGAVVNLPGGGGNDPFIAPNFVIFDVTITTDVGQPVTAEFRGKCDNAFRSASATG